jgi:hypothetical protein
MPRKFSARAWFLLGFDHQLKSKRRHPFKKQTQASLKFLGL